MARNQKPQLTEDERRLLAYALCAMVESAPAEHSAALQTDASIVATKLGIVNELSHAITLQRARVQQQTPE